MNIKTLIKLSLPSLLILNLVGCESNTRYISKPVKKMNWTNQPIENASYLKQGMTEKQTIEIMGTPIIREFKERRSALQWCKTGNTNSKNLPYDRFIVAFFTNKYLTEIRNYSNKDLQQYGDCSTLYREVRWLDPVNNVIELRKRNLY